MISRGDERGSRPPSRNEFCIPASEHLGSSNKEKLQSRSDIASEHEQTDMNNEFGKAMNSEFVFCSVEKFREAYLPFALANTDPRVEAVVEQHFDWLKTVPKGRKDAAFAELEAISKTASSISIPGRTSNGRLIHMVPDTRRVSTTKGCNRRIDASLVENKAKETFAMTDIIAFFEFKVDRDQDTRLQNQLQIISDCVHILQDDVRRMFTYAITIESHRMTLWYISRSHCAKSVSFDYIKEPGTLVSVLVSLLFATEEELGYDPRVHLRIQNLKYSWIYEFHGESETGGQAEARFFLTRRSVLEPRGLCVSDRTTRIFEAREIETKDAEPSPSARPVIIKDVWLDEDALTEKGIQGQLFADIDAFVGRDDWKKDPRVAHFVGDAAGFMTQLEELFRDGGYKKLFLCVEDESTGKPSKPAPLEAWVPHPPIFSPKLDAPAEREEFTAQTTRSDVKASIQRTLRRVPESGSPPSCKHREYAPKRRSFLLFKDICTTVHYLPTLGDAMTVLSECLTALCIMFCAGWVHRDISVGNIMAIWNTETERWTVKLGDLEYAKRFPFSSPGSSDPKTGTPFFMPCEVLSQRYIGEHQVLPKWELLEQEDDEEEEEEAAVQPFTSTPVVHNFQHDVESLYWICLWLITARVNCVDSARYVNPIFQKTMSLPQARRNAFELNIASPLKNKILPALKYPLRYLESFRLMLYTSVTDMGQAGGWNDLDRYGLTYLNTYRIFAYILSARGNWAAVPLQGSRQSSTQVYSNSEPARAKRRIAHEDDESEPAAKARKMAPDTVVT